MVSGVMNWSDAITSCNNLEFPALPGEEYEDWRLPNIRELQSLIDYGQINSALPSGHPFTTIRPSYYWSSTSYADDSDMIWIVNMKDGSVSLGNKNSDAYYVWPVRSGL